MIPDLSQWKFVRKETMRTKTVGDWNEKLKEIQVWEGVDEKTTLRVWIHELLEMIGCSIRGVTDEDLLKYDKSHNLALNVETAITKLLGEDLLEYEKQIVEYEDKVKYESD